ncbi:MAG TPA: hypothetical protein VM694_01540 [Polyangium sp.]|uniref:Uncharacterized protein n=3 Tax=Polyangium TaxID=55 RepID=A0A9X3XAU6_9BACT|nr:MULTISPECIES: hypothetical protein [Polyangium]HVK63122.1 hypothetical protein [Polyangium sp.]MDC0746884.1 hypothetical protein [Polyangium mundeleinium]MDC3958652.1 hypothetical protein [Polyangium jinanense]MDC3987279.1 hypothetical protein [Polyangium jinanense]MDI1435076.1 hypothetical protein [Polyangium sorediatum]
MPDFGQITPQHVIYIPSVLLLGLVVGYTLGARAVRAELEKRKRRMKE